ncbi:hypothetical protein AV530_020048 [Patagioenas fasciata monilis]|uniref:Uncharacterized protein n=1 Tax=Patagioenas fasciata monilis TaxID=372326 RepID=A0A1V4JHU9_PATFA|nr:hypothetical protein AV530_020048 [Patagioenas fasciata monilis]
MVKPWTLLLTPEEIDTFRTGASTTPRLLGGSRQVIWEARWIQAKIIYISSVWETLSERPHEKRVLCSVCAAHEGGCTLSVLEPPSLIPDPI